MVGEKLGSFRITGTLGTGAMGVVYKAVNENTGKVAAVKVIHSDVVQKGKAYERFRREAEILQQFRHPNIVRFLALGRYQGTSYFAMEFIQGRTLEQWLKDRGPLPWKEVVDLGRQLCEALHYAHEHGVVHRDLKPSNLMVTDDGRVKLTDFGIAKDLDATALTATGRTLGTAAYMAPEQIRGTPEVSHKTDLYALGIVFYQMLTGDLPFDGSSAMVLMHAHINAKVPRVSSKLAEIPKALDDLVWQLMAKDQATRPWDAAAVAETLKGISERASRGETIPMVWPAADQAPDPFAATHAMDQTSAKKATAVKSRSKTRNTARRREEDGAATFQHRLVTAGLLTLLLGMCVLGYFLLRPYTQEQLYRKAEVLMASEKRTDWMEARDRYIDLLDRRYPDNPYKKETRAWRDKLLLAEAEGRAKTLSSGVQTRLSDPQNPNEERFVGYNTRVQALTKVFDETGAAAVWDEMATEIKGDGEEDARGWHLLAKSRAEALRKGVELRQKIVAELMVSYGQAKAEGQEAKAQALRQEVLSKYGKYSDVAEILNPGGAAPAPTEPGANPRG